MAESIDPRVEEPARALLGYALDEELEEFDDTLQRVIDEDLFIAVMTLIGRVSSVAVVRRCGDKAPADGEFERIATELIDFYSGSYALEHHDVVAFLERVLFGGEPVDQVLGTQKSVLVPVIVAATLLSSSSDAESWHQYLDALESGLEQSGGTSHLTAQDSDPT